jgi:hypothetical protein
MLEFHGGYDDIEEMPFRTGAMELKDATVRDRFFGVITIGDSVVWRDDKGTYSAEAAAEVAKAVLLEHFRLMFFRR